jgi:hypothetical protein
VRPTRGVFLLRCIIGPCPTIVVGACISAFGCLGLLWIGAVIGFGAQARG